METDQQNPSPIVPEVFSTKNGCDASGFLLGCFLIGLLSELACVLNPYAFLVTSFT